MDAANIATIVVAAIAALSAWASQRAASRASTVNALTSSRVDMEKEAYDRARAYDTETIKRQDEEIADLRSENNTLKLKCEACEREIASTKAAHAQELSFLRQRIARLEAGFQSNLEEMLRERLDEPESDGSDTAV